MGLARQAAVGGTLERTGDLDVFLVRGAPAQASLSVGVAAKGPDVDVEATVFDAACRRVAAFNPPTLLTAAVSYAAAGRDFYLQVRDGVLVDAPSAGRGCRMLAQSRRLGRRGLGGFLRRPRGESVLPAVTRRRGLACT